MAAMWSMYVFRLMIVVAALALSCVVRADVLFVDDDANLGGDGLSWDTAYRYLQDALTVASSPGSDVTEIRVAQGIHRPNEPVAPLSDCCEPHTSSGCDDRECEAAICALLPQCCDTGWRLTCVCLVDSVCDLLCGVDREAVFQLVNGVSLFGGFAGIGAADPDARDIVLYETTLSGDLLGDDRRPFINRDDNARHVVTAVDIDSRTAVDGFTIRSGNGALYGGGIMCEYAAVSILNCRFVENQSRYGAAIHNCYGDVAVSNCCFDGNSAVDTGGGIHNLYGDLVVRDCTFTANSAGDGGAIDHNATSLTVTGSLFSENVAFRGGAIVLEFGEVLISDCVFSGNSASRSGAMSIGSNGTIKDCLFTNNSSSLIGGAMTFTAHFDELVVVGCTFIGNWTDGRGGALVNYGTPTVLNCLFLGNTAVIG